MSVSTLLVGAFLICALWNLVLTRRRVTSDLSSRQRFRLSGDDPVLSEFSKRRRERRLHKADSIPALTDKTFSATVYNRHNKLVLVLFYSPFDPMGMLFLEQYEQAGRELVARMRDFPPSSSSSSHPLARVNCYDWTDVCRKENVTSYPVIHLYRKGKWRQRYRDAFDKDVLIRTVFLLQCDQPLWLQTEEEVEDFLNGRLPEAAHELVNNLVLLRPSASLSEVAAFTEVVRELGTQMLFAVVSPEVQAHIGVEVGLLHVRLNDDHQPYDTLTRDLDTLSVRQFLLHGKYPLLPELTFRNFPELYGRQRPLAILFRSHTDPEASVHARTVVDIIRSEHVHNLTFCTMAVHKDNPAAEELLRTYTGHTDLPAFVIVHLQQRTVHWFPDTSLTVKGLLVWILMIQHGKIDPTNYLVEESWQPVSSHFDFLDKQDRERKRKERPNIQHQHAVDRGQSTSDSDDGDLVKQTMSSDAQKPEWSGTLSEEDTDIQNSERKQLSQGSEGPVLHTDL